MRVLLDAGANPNARNSGGISPLLLAFGSGRPETNRVITSRPVSGFVEVRGVDPCSLAEPNRI